MAKNLIITGFPNVMHCPIDGQDHDYYMLTPDEYWILRHRSLVNDSETSQQNTVTEIRTYIDVFEANIIYGIPARVMYKAIEQRKIRVFKPDAKTMLFHVADVEYVKSIMSYLL